MIASDSWSGRGSARVESPHSLSPGETVVWSRRGPESTSSRTGSYSPTPEGQRRVGARQLDRLRNDFSARDRAILSDLHKFHFLSTSQLQSLHFSQHTTEPAAARICRRVLARLADCRVIEHLERRIGGIRAGSASYVWRVGPVGDRLLRQAAGDGARARRKEPSLRHLDHSLAVADCALALVTAARTGRLELLSTTTEPDCWRHYHGSGGARETLKPDLYAVTASGDYEDHWFIEVDRATESLPVLLKQCAQYERYRRTGHAQADGGVFPRVLWVMPDERRGAQLQRGLGVARTLDAALFRTTTAECFIEAVFGGAT